MNFGPGENFGNSSVRAQSRIEEEKVAVHVPEFQMDFRTESQHHLDFWG